MREIFIKKTYESSIPAVLKRTVLIMSNIPILALSVGAVEYTDCFSAEG